jgi:hypothetical protein
MTSKTINIYNFSGAITDDITFTWNNNINSSTSTIAPTDNLNPWVASFINSGPDVLVYNLLGTEITMVLNYDNNNIATVYILNDPNITVDNSQTDTISNNMFSLDTAYIINGSQYQSANTYDFIMPFLGFSIPAVSQADMEKLTLVTDAFAPVTQSRPTLTADQKGKLSMIPGAFTPTVQTVPIRPTPTTEQKEKYNTKKNSLTSKSNSTNYWVWAYIVIIIILFMAVIGAGINLFVSK